MKLSKYLTYIEATKSETAIRKGIDNTPNTEQLLAMRFVATNGFDWVREKVNGPLHASSFFRSPELNVAIGGAKNSQHCKGEAIDIDCDKFGNGDNKMIFYLIRHDLDFDQLIWEFGDDTKPAWVHLSMKKTGNRKEVLRAFHTQDGDTKYIPFDLTSPGL